MLFVMQMSAQDAVTTAGSSSAAKNFFDRYPVSTRSLQDYLRSAPPADALKALFDGVFDGDVGSSNVGPYTVDNPSATTVPELGTVGCILGYTGAKMAKSDLYLPDSKREWPTMHCDEPFIKDPSTVAFAWDPLFYGAGCVPNDSCERREPCPAGTTVGGASLQLTAPIQEICS
jgi:hypothetical protein